MELYTYVDPEEAANIESQLKSMTDPIIFTDMFDSKNVVALADFHGMFETSKPIRENCIEYDKAIREETPDWSA